MRSWKAYLLGLLAACALLGVGIEWYWPQIEAFLVKQLPASVESRAPALAMPTIVVPRTQTNQDPGAPMPPAAPKEASPASPGMPNIIRPGGAGAGPGHVTQMPLPAAIYPPGGKPDSRFGPGEGISGAGFFIADDGTLLTAAHVVPNCSRTQISSPYFPPAAATVLATDTVNDIALLRAATIRPPAVLPIGRTTSNSRSLFFIGYPGADGKPVRTESRGTLENARLSAVPGAVADPRQQIWFQNRAMTQGFSGGAILDLASGGAVGIVKATVMDGSLRQMRGMPATGMAIGPGVAPLTSFLAREATNLVLSSPTEFGEQAVAIARLATVNVQCWRR